MLASGKHGSYLQGMETGWANSLRLKSIALHGSYLQGMETYNKKRNKYFERCTDPTYKEWKRITRNAISTLSAARILPTRNGNVMVSEPSEVFITARILPTRNGNGKRVTSTSSRNTMHGSYLQGMETHHSILIETVSQLARILPTRNGNRLTKDLYNPATSSHGSYLQGMETCLYITY